MKPQDIINVWNVHDGISAYAGAQPIFNVVGRVDNALNVERLSYRINGGPLFPVCFKNASNGPLRLERLGDFNIDTIDASQILEQNTLHLVARFKNGREVVRTIRFPVRRIHSTSGYKLDLRDANHPEEIGQLVDGRWRISRSGGSRSCLEIPLQDTGLDRIILFSKTDSGSEYRVRARLAVTAWTGSPCNLGILFDWNPHLQGDGKWLPGQWTTGLGYYYSHCRGLRIRIGVNVHLDHRGKKSGDHILGEACLSPVRYLASAVLTGARLINAPLPQVVPGREYYFELSIKKDHYSLTVWMAGDQQKSPQITIVEPPVLLLRTGVVGIIAHRCALRIYDFELSRA